MMEAKNSPPVVPMVTSNLRNIILRLVLLQNASGEKAEALYSNSDGRIRGVLRLSNNAEVGYVAFLGGRL